MLHMPVLVFVICDIFLERKKLPLIGKLPEIGKVAQKLQSVLTVDSRKYMEPWVNFCWACAAGISNPYTIIVYFWSILWPIIDLSQSLLGKWFSLYSQSPENVVKGNPDQSILQKCSNWQDNVYHWKSLKQVMDFPSWNLQYVCRSSKVCRKFQCIQASEYTSPKTNKEPQVFICGQQANTELWSRDCFRLSH